MFRFFGTVTDNAGNVVPACPVRVTIAGTTSVASLYQDDETTALTNPNTTDSNGVITYRCLDQVVDVVASMGGYTFPTSAWVGIPAIDVQKAALSEGWGIGWGSNFLNILPAGLNAANSAAIVIRFGRDTRVLQGVQSFAVTGLAASAWYYLYGVQSGAGVAFTVTTLQPDISGVQSGNQQTRYMMSFRSTALSAIAVFEQHGATIMTDYGDSGSQILSAGNAGTFTPVTNTLGSPASRLHWLQFQLVRTGGADYGVFVRETGTGISGNVVAVVANAGNYASAFYPTPVNTAQQFDYYNNAAGATTIRAAGYVETMLEGVLR